MWYFPVEIGTFVAEAPSPDSRNSQALVPGPESQSDDVSNASYVPLPHVILLVFVLVAGMLPTLYIG